MADGDFIHLADVGAMIGDCGNIRNYLERRANSGKGFRELPPLRDSLDCRMLTPPNDQVRKWASTNKMSEMSVNSMLPLLFAAALEHEDVNEKLRDIFTRISLYMGEDVVENKDFLQEITDAANAPRRTQEEAQLRRMKKANNERRDFANRIAEVEQRLESRKMRFVRSLRKMINVAGSYEGLSHSDKKCVKYLERINWILRDDQDRLVVNEKAITEMNPSNSFRVLQELKSYIEK